MRLDGTAIVAEHAELGRPLAVGERHAGGAVLRERDEHRAAVRRPERDAVPEGRDQRPRRRGAATVNPGQTGTKAAFHYRLEVAAGQSATVELRLSDTAAGLGDDFDEVMAAREAEADEFYAELTPAGTSEDEALVLRQALAGMLWSKQFYHYDVERWLEGDPAGPPPPAERWNGRNHDWTHLNNLDVISMPDTWEYPWYAAWDLAFHCVALAHVDPEFAKAQLILLCREWYMHPNGQLPAYEWEFGDVNPPVHAWAALRVFEIAGDGDVDFLERVFHKLLLNFTWWVNRKDAEGNNVFEGGFLGLDNIGPFDRSALPVRGHARAVRRHGLDGDVLPEPARASRSSSPSTTRPTRTLATKFFEHFALIASALNDKGLWDEEDGFYYDVLRLPDGGRLPLKARSIVGLLPLAAVSTLGPETIARLPDFAARAASGSRRQPPRGAGGRPAHDSDRPRTAGGCSRSSTTTGCGGCSRAMLDPDEFLSDHGLRALSKRPRGHPLDVDVDGVSRDARLRAGRVDERPVRRQLELARAGLVPDQLPAHRSAARLPPLPRRRASRSSTRPARAGS